MIKKFTSLFFLALVGTTMTQTISVQDVLRDRKECALDDGF